MDKKSSVLSESFDHQVKEFLPVAEGPSSKHFAIYNMFFKGMDSFSIDVIINQSLQELNANKIWYSNEKFSSQMGIMVLSNTKDWKIVNLLVSLSYFTFELSVLNKSEGSVFSSCMNVANGGMGTIYRIQNQRLQSKSIVKSLKHKISQPVEKAEQNFNIKQLNIVRLAIKQYCLNKLCSVLRIGPKVVNLFGFDLMISDLTVDFALQQCKPLKTLNIQQFGYHLKVLHDLQIIHGDIKLDNLMWSPSFKKPILIDFGLSKCLKERPSEMTFTHFFGTVFYCSPDMKSLLYNNRQEGGVNFVDLYYNDVHCLQKSIQIFQKRKKNQPKYDSFYANATQRRLVQTLIYNFTIMKHIYDRDLQIFKTLQSSVKKFDIFPEIIELLCELPSSKVLFKMICIIERMSIISLETAQKLKSYHSGRKKLNLNPPSLSKNFEKRFDQILRVDVPITNLMVYLMIFWQEDITPRSKQRKFEIESQLKSYKTIDQNFTQKLAQYISNLFVTQQNIKQIFKLTYQLLKQQKHEQYNIYQEACQIVIILKQKHQINLIEINQRVRMKQRMALKEYQITLTSKQFQRICDWLYSFAPDKSQVFITNRNESNEKRIENVKRQSHHLLIKISKGRIAQECEKIQAASKTLPCRLKLEQNFDEISTSMKKYELYSEEKFKKSVNLCLSPEILVFFNFFSFIESNFLNPSASILEIQQGVTKMKKFFELFFSPRAYSKLSVTITSKIKRFKHYKIYENLDVAIKIVKILKQFHQQVFFKNLAILDLSAVTSAYECFLAFTFLLQKQQFNKLAQILQRGDDWNLYEEKRKYHFLLLKFVNVKIELNFKFNVLTMAQTIQKLNHLSKWFQYAEPLIEIQFIHFALKYSIYANEQKTVNYYAQRVQSLFLSLSHSDKLKFFQSSILNPYMQMYYAMSKIESFPRAFRHLISLIEVYNDFSLSHRQMDFIYYLFLRNAVWPYVNKNELLTIAQYYIIQTKQIQRQKGYSFLNLYGNLVVIFDMLLSSIYTYHLQKDAKNVMEDILRLIQLLLNHCSLLMRRRVQRKYYIIIAKFIKQEVIEPSSRGKLYFYQLKQFRNQQYPIKKVLLEGMKKPKGVQKERRLFLHIQRNMKKWNENKKSKVKIVQSDMHSLPVGYFQFLTNQQTVEQSVLHKELDCGMPSLLYKNQQSFWSQVSTSF